MIEMEAALAVMLRTVNATNVTAILLHPLGVFLFSYAVLADTLLICPALLACE